jgi:hypothetical protein
MRGRVVKHCGWGFWDVLREEMHGDGPGVAMLMQQRIQ